MTTRSMHGSWDELRKNEMVTFEAIRIVYSLDGGSGPEGQRNPRLKSIGTARSPVTCAKTFHWLGKTRGVDLYQFVILSSDY
jgi:hypothetical protein